MKNCCDKWVEGIKHINSFIFFSNVHSAGPKFNQIYSFKYCPWCGKIPIVEEEFNKDKE